MVSGLPIASVTGFLDVLAQFTQAVVTKVRTPLEERIDAAVAVNEGIEERIRKLVGDSLTLQEQRTQQFVGAILASPQASLDRFDSLLSSFEDSVLAGQRAFLDDVQVLLDEKQGGILDSIRGGLEAVAGFTDDVTTKARDAIEGRLDAAQATLDGLGQKLGGVPALIDAAIEQSVGAVAQDLGAGFKGLGDTLNKGLKGVLSSFYGELSEDVVARVDGIVSLIEDEEDLPEEIRRLTAPGFLPLGVVGGFLAGLAIPIALGQAIAVTMDPFLQKVRQRMSRLAKEGLLTPQDIAQAWQRGLVPKPYVEENLLRQGFGKEDQRLILELAKNRPGTLDLIDYWRRDLVNEAALDLELTQLGWAGEYISLFKAAAFPPPGVQDLITMAVREVFTPEIAAKFGQFEDLPQPFIDHARTVGFSEYWARNAWAAHWQLPSIFQGFEMFHRTLDKPIEDGADEITLPSGAKVYNTIGRKTLDLLLRSADVMPFWRQPLVEIAYNPLTRVDVRRMHQMGILDEDGVYRAYLDLGYRPDHAGALTLFTLRLNAKDLDPETAAQRDLTRADVLGLMNDGLLTAQEATAHLTALGYDDNEAAVLVEREVVQQMRAERKGQIEEVQQRAKLGLITLSDAQDQLDQLNATTVEKQKAINAILKALDVRPNRPTKKELGDWLQSGALDVKGFVAELQAQGWADRYIVHYVADLTLEWPEEAQADAAQALADARMADVLVAQYKTLAGRFEADSVSIGPGSGASEEGVKVLNRSEVLRLLRLGLITDRQAVGRIMDLGMSQNDAELLVKAELLKARPLKDLEAAEEE